ncbi:alpha/beta hydrolase family protein [Phyllobacterium sp. P5_D12]
MKKRKTRELTRACLFSALLALLMGCNNDGGVAQGAPPVTDQNTPEGTFAGETVMDEGNVVDDTKVPNEPVVGEVKEVPDTEPKPLEKTGGEPNPIDGLLDTAASKGASRFIETAPDTIGGQTFWSSPAYEYNLGNLVAVASGDSATFGNGATLLTPIHGWIRYPRDAMGPPLSTTFPVIILLHGNHSAADASYKGYDYLAEHLATHGYVVLSIDANAINGLGTRGVDPWAADASSQSRAQLMLGTLDRLRQVNEQGQINPDGMPGALNGLKGKLDFSRIGIMGHSRGGQGVTNTILFNMVRRGTTEQDLIAAVSGGPVSIFRLSRSYCRHYYSWKR